MLGLEVISEIFYVHTHFWFIEKERKIRLFSLSQEQIFGRAGIMFSDSQPCGLINWEQQTQDLNQIQRETDFKAVTSFNEICFFMNSTFYN